MVKKINKSNPALLSLIHNLKKHSNENNAPIWKDIAKRLEKPLKNRSEINLNKINKYINENEIALVPGKVLSTGELTKKITIAAWNFTERSREKIKKAGSKYISIEELINENPDGKNIRILG